MKTKKNVNKSKMNKAWSIMIVLATFASVGAQEEEPRILDEIVAKVNDEIITLTDLNQVLADRRMELRDESGNPAEAEQRFQAEKPNLLRNLIQSKLMLQKASELGIDANMGPEVEAFLENMRQEMGIPSLDVLDQYLQQRGSSLQKFRRKIRESQIVQKVVENLVYSRITLLTLEVEAYYEENAAEFSVPSKVELAEILFLTEGKKKSEVRKQAEQVLERLQKGDSFEELAKEYSEGPTASKGGQIGTFNRGTMNQELEDVAFLLEVGKTSQIISSDFGFQIIKVLDRSEGSSKPLDEVRPQITQTLYERKARPEIERFLKELIRESYIFVSPEYVEEYNLEGLI
jgi:parvulin-like peptidyl-prolyl isomerase